MLLGVLPLVLPLSETKLYFHLEEEIETKPALLAVALAGHATQESRAIYKRVKENNLDFGLLFGRVL